MEIGILVYLLASLVVGFTTARDNAKQGQRDDLIGLSFFVAAIIWPFFLICMVVGKIIKWTTK